MARSSNFPSQFLSYKSTRNWARELVLSYNGHRRLVNGAYKASVSILAYLYWERPTTFSRRVIWALKKSVDKEGKFSNEDFKSALIFLNNINKIRIVESDGEDDLILEPGANNEINRVILKSKKHKKRGRGTKP